MPTGIEFSKRISNVFALSLNKIEYAGMSEEDLTEIE
jgi:hypothetical protein